MKVTVNSASEYKGKDEASVESFDLSVEGEAGDTPESVAKKYLVLRKILKDGIKE